MATNATETLNWSGYSGYISDGATFDTGATLITVNTAHSGTTNTYVAPTTGGRLQTGLPKDAKTMLSQAGAGQSTRTTFSFGDDTTMPGVVNTAERLSFAVYGIDSMAGRYTDVVTFKATDVDGRPIPITVSAPENATFRVHTAADGTVTLTGTQALADGKPLASAAQISFDGPVDRLTIAHNGSGGSSQVYIGNMTFVPSGATALCFARGTMILTRRGSVPVEVLKPGDLVVTRDHGLQPIRWIASTTRALSADSHLRPVLIRAHALGNGYPDADLMVSPQHRILVRSAIAQRIFGTDEVLVAAKQLVQIEGIDFAAGLDEVEYFHFLFNDHEIVFANGAESESLFTGPEALRSISRAARDEIFALFPQLTRKSWAPQAARLLASGRAARQLAKRHAQNHKALVS